MNIVATVAEDLPQILAITNDEILHRVAHFGMIPVTPEQIQQEFAAAAGTHPWFTATDGARVLGFAKAYPWKPRGAYRWTAEIGVYVVPGQQGKGIGRGLYAKLFPAMEAAGLRTVIAGIALPNAASVRLHESFGMKHTGTFTNVGYKFGAWHDVGYWTGSLGDPAPAPNLSLAWR